MKRYLFFAIFLSVIFGCSKNDINDKSKRNEHWAWWEDEKTGKEEWIPINNDSSNLDKGRYILFYFNGNIREKGRLDKGVNVDTIFDYNLNGKLIAFKSITVKFWYYYEDGPIKLYSAIGKIREEGIIKNHKFGDKWTQYYENGEIRFVNNFVNDTGWIVNFYETGQLKDSVYHVKGLGDFIIKSWYENGKIEKLNTFNGCGLNGPTKKYYENGQLRNSGTYVNGKWEGIQIQWFEDGQLKAKINCKNDIINGQQIVYHKNGKVNLISNYKNGILSGEVKQYDVNGNIIRNEYYKNGEKIK